MVGNYIVGTLIPTAHAHRKTLHSEEVDDARMQMCEEHTDDMNIRGMVSG
jgi:hypothetical protein